MSFPRISRLSANGGLGSFLTVLLFALVPAFRTVRAAEAKEKAPRPNVLLIMVDDMGFSDLGCYGGEIDTPNLDALAADGLRFTQFYNTGRCWPTRASLVTGLYPHEAGNAMRYGDSAPPAYRGTNKAVAPMVSELLHDAGYRTYHVGKWHLDKPKEPETWPLGRGYDRSYAIRQQDNFFNPKIMYDEHFVVKRPGDQGNYYVTTALTERTVHYLDEHQTYHKGEPFFIYLAHTAPHFPLHALAEDVARFRGRYKEGWDAVRQKRRKRMKEMGIIDCDLSERDPDAAAWDSLSEEEKDMWDGRMAVHAAMIYRVDVGVGQIVKKLEQMGALEDTLILFLSDNGASAEYIVRGDGHDPNAPLGSGDTYRCLEVGWANAANTPFRMHKIWVHEGGISTPLIAHWPKGVKARGELTPQPGHVIDVVPTLLDLAGVEEPEKMSGLSLAPIFKGETRKGHEQIYWEHQGNRAIRQGDWKLVSQHETGDQWELYNLDGDRSEMHDLVDQYPEKVKELNRLWQDWADQAGVVKWGSFPESLRGPGGEYRQK